MLQITNDPFLSGGDDVVMVHGWNMTSGKKQAFGETAFKRLYWQGFKGNFHVFNWPTFANTEGPNYFEDTNFTFNASEFQAYRSGNALKNLLKSLQAGSSEKVHLLAHSMGNFVAAEALRLWAAEPELFPSGPLVDSYTAMESAMSAGAFGVENNGTAGTDAFHINRPDWHIRWNKQSHSKSEADLYRYWSHGDKSSYAAAKPYMQGTEHAAGKWINLYNPNDFATNLAWRLNNLVKSFTNRFQPVSIDLDDLASDVTQAARIIAPLHSVFGEAYYNAHPELLMPPPEVWPHRYALEIAGDGTRRFYRIPYFEEGEFDNPPEEITEHLTTPWYMYPQGHPGPNGYEILAFLSQANVATLGNTPAPGFFQVNINISNPIQSGITLPKSVVAPENHSFQFNYDVVTTWRFWQIVKEETGMTSTY